MRFRFRSPIPLAPLSLPFPSLFPPTLRYSSRLTGSDHELSSNSLVKPIDPCFALPCSPQVNLIQFSSSLLSALSGDGRVTSSALAECRGR